MENKLEQLLNSLIEKGWKPFGKPFKSVIDMANRGVRYITSKESGLWQFVCENEMIKLKFGDRRHYNTDNYRDKICLDCNYPYRLMEASLKDESELEDFLLDNIKIDGTTK